MKTLTLIHSYEDMSVVIFDHIFSSTQQNRAHTPDFLNSNEHTKMASTVILKKHVSFES